MSAPWSRDFAPHTSVGLTPSFLLPLALKKALQENVQRRIKRFTNGTESSIIFSNGEKYYKSFLNTYVCQKYEVDAKMLRDSITLAAVEPAKPVLMIDLLEKLPTVTVAMVFGCSNGIMLLFFRTRCDCCGHAFGYMLDV